MEIEHKICCSCGENKEISLFFRNCGRNDGYEARCKQCKKTNKKCVARRGKKKEKEYIEPNIQDDFTFLHPTKEDWAWMYQMLQRLGYDLNENIHKQFCQKYGLQPKKDRYKKFKKINHTDLDL